MLCSYGLIFGTDFNEFKFCGACSRFEKREYKSCKIMFESCAMKIPYNEKQSIIGAKHRNKNNYKCTYCGHWHIGE